VVVGGAVVPDEPDPPVEPEDEELQSLDELELVVGVTEVVVEAWAPVLAVHGWTVVVGCPEVVTGMVLDRV
jgi:hypothetical protein